MLRQPEVYVTGPEEECPGMKDSERFPEAVSLTELSHQVEKMSRQTRLYSVQGCARAVKGTKIEAAVEVASEEDSEFCDIEEWGCDCRSGG